MSQNVKRVRDEPLQQTDDISSIKMPEKANVQTNKWNVLGVIDPNKHLSTLDILNEDFLNEDLAKLSVVNYHQWIPSVFQINEDCALLQCELLSEIPNCPPNLYPLIKDLFLHQLLQFENVTGLFGIVYKNKLYTSSIIMYGITLLIRFETKECTS